MSYNQLEPLKKSDKSTVYLVYDRERRRMAVEKHLSGELNIYLKLRELSHRNLPEIYDVQIQNGKTVVLEEYIPGGSLASVKVGEKQIVRWMLELCSVLTFLHRRGILHRDIKPSNLLLGEDGHLRLIDFDAAREEKPEVEQDTRLLGTRGYAPPEQYGFAQTDNRADIYALGITFRELLGTAAGKLRWKHILSKCTAVDVKRRYRHVWQIQWAVLSGKLRRWVLYPVLAAVTALFIGFTALSYTTDMDFRQAMDILLSSRRDLVFDTADIPRLKRTDGGLVSFMGDTATPYLQLKEAYPQLEFISTGYCDENGFLLFGGFTQRYSVETGQRYYDEFGGLFTTQRHISPENCTAYAPAVLALYELEIFDTPLF